MYYLNQLINRYPSLILAKKDIGSAYECILQSYKKGGKLLIAGNGGSSADSEHMAGELMKEFTIPRTLNQKLKKKLIETDENRGEFLANTLEMPLPAIPLTGMDSFSSACLNDMKCDIVFAQKVLALGKKGDVFLGISTSGNSQNVVDAAIVAKALDMNVIGMTGVERSKLSEISDICIRVPEKETYRIQELHLPIYHCICQMLESYFFEEAKDGKRASK